jgi:hypothetical protein
MPPEQGLPEGSTSSDLSGIDVDGLLAGGESEAPEIPMGDEPAESTQAPAQGEKSAAQQAAELAFTWNGKQIKVPLGDPKATQWLSQGYDYAQKMQAFKRDQAEFERQRQAIAELESRYKPVEEYYSQNPDRWQYVNQQYEALKNGQNASDPIAQKIQFLESKLSQTDQFIQNLQNEKLVQQRQQEDQALDQEVRSIQEEFKDLDWSTPDADGKPLEIRVLEHAHKIGTKSFRAAFRDLNHEHLLKLAEERAKENVVKEQQKKTKLGLLGQSQAPKKGITNAEDFKNKSYDDLIDEAIAELGLGA